MNWIAVFFLIIIVCVRERVAEGERRVCVWCVHTNVCRCSANMILCRGQKRMSMSCFITLHLVPLRHHQSLNLEISWLPARLSDSPVSIPNPVHKTDGILPGFFCGCGGLLLRSYACSASTLTHCATSQLRLIIKLTIICREKPDI